MAAMLLLALVALSQGQWSFQGYRNADCTGPPNATISLIASACSPVGFADMRYEPECLGSWQIRISPDCEYTGSVPVVPGPSCHNFSTPLGMYSMKISGPTTDGTCPTKVDVLDCWKDAHLNNACALRYRLLDWRYAVSPFTVWPNLIYLAWIIVTILVGKMAFFLQLMMHYKITRPHATASDFYVPPPPPLYHPTKSQVHAGKKVKAKSKGKEADEDPSYSEYSEQQEEETAEDAAVEAQEEQFRRRMEGDTLMGDEGTMLGFSLSYHIVFRDNKAISICFSAYMFALGLVVHSSMEYLKPEDPVANVANCIFWSCFGFFLLMLANALNNIVVYGRMANTLAIMWGCNEPMAYVEGAAYIAAGIIVSGATSGPSHKLYEDVASAGLYFILGQLAFVVFARIYMWFIDFDLLDELKGEGFLKTRNKAAAVTYALDMITIAILLGNATTKSAELLNYFVWIAMSCICMFLFRAFCHATLFGKRSSFVEEIVHDQNWGLALLMGGMQIAYAISISNFLPNICSDFEILQGQLLTE